MKRNSDFTIKDYLKELLITVQIDRQVTDETYLNDFEGFCQKNFFEINEATSLLTELDLMKDEKLKPSQQHYDAGLFEQVWVREELLGKEVYRLKNFITDRGEYYLGSILINLNCLSSYGTVFKK